MTIKRPAKFRSFNAAQAWHDAMMALSGKVDVTHVKDEFAEANGGRHKYMEKSCDLCTTPPERNNDVELSAIEEAASRKAPDDMEDESDLG